MKVITISKCTECPACHIDHDQCQCVRMPGKEIVNDYAYHIIKNIFPGIPNWCPLTDV